MHCILLCAGLDFDLKPLTKSEDKDGNAYYRVPFDDYVYYINVCDKVKGSPCDNNAGVCQGKPSDAAYV